MKRNRWVRLGSLLIALCLMMTLLPATAQASEDERENVDFVLLIDYSNTMDSNDPKGRAVTACQMFLDMIPIEDARVSVIAFGYEGKEPYAYENFQVTKGRDHYYVHEVSEMEGQLSEEKKDVIKGALANLSGSDGQKTPIGAALAAGVDTLLRNGTTEGNGYVIMLSDGYFTSTENVVNNTLTDQALQKASANKWPIYCLEMDYEGNNEEGRILKDNGIEYYNGKEARELLNRVVSESGAGVNGRKHIVDADAIEEDFMEIFHEIWPDDDGGVFRYNLDDKGAVKGSFKVETLVSEATITISSDQVDKVRLVGPSDSGFDKEFSGNQSDDSQYIVTKGKDYMCVKLICPAIGEWDLTVYGDPNANIVMYMGTQKEMNLRLVANDNRTNASDPLTKDYEIKVQALYTYNGADYPYGSVYEDTASSAKVVVTYENGNKKTFDMQGSRDGYICTIPCVKLDSGNFTIHVEVNSSIFRSGSASSMASQTFSLVNLALEYVGGDTNRAGYVNSQFDRVNLNDVLYNPDGDTVFFGELVCTSDKNAVFEYNKDELANNGYLDIQTGMAPGTYEMEITAKDAEMKDPLVHKFTLTVDDRAVIAEAIPRQEVWVSTIPLLGQNPANETLEVNLDDYFSDPDGVTLTYSNPSWSAQEESEVQLNPEIDGNVLRITGDEKGMGTVYFDVYDGVSVTSGQLQVKAVTGFAMFWADTWLYFVIAGILLAVLIIFLIVKKALTKPKGKWSVVLKMDGNSLTTNGQVDLSTLKAFTSAKKKGKVSFLLMDALNNCSRFFMASETVDQWISEFFTNGDASKIELRGVFLGTGFIVQKIPSSNDVKVFVSGREVNGKKERTNAEEVHITINRVNLDPSSDQSQTLHIFIAPYTDAPVAGDDFGDSYGGYGSDSSYGGGSDSGSGDDSYGGYGSGYGSGSDSGSGEGGYGSYGGYGDNSGSGEAGYGGYDSGYGSDSGSGNNYGY